MQPVRSGRLPEDDVLERVSLDAAFGKLRSRCLQVANTEKLSTVTGTRGSTTP